jgi:lipoprotein-releasing system ATP-binding protein
VTVAASAANGVLVEISRLSRTYHIGPKAVEVLRDVTLTLSAGERVAIVGPSGSGKSTFLHTVGLLDAPPAGDGAARQIAGRILLDGRDVSLLSEPERAAIRGRRIGFVFQAHHLLPEHSALGNVMIPVRLAGGSVATAEIRARSVLEAVGLGPRLEHRPGQLSGGEQQRVAIARALVMAPGLVLADEPTGNLDPETAQGVFELLLDLNQQLGSTLVVVTHSRELASRFPRRLALDGGSFREW